MKISKSTIDSRDSEHSNIKFVQWTGYKKKTKTEWVEKNQSHKQWHIFFLLWLINSSRHDESSLYQFIQLVPKFVWFSCYYRSNSTLQISTVFDRSKIAAPKNQIAIVMWLAILTPAQIIVRIQPAADDTFQKCVCALIVFSSNCCKQPFRAISH